MTNTPDETWVDLGGGMAVPLRELIDDEVNELEWGGCGRDEADFDREYGDRDG
jgi:hypothetical protein